MEPASTPPPPAPKDSKKWPLIVNLGILLMVAMAEPSMLGIAVVGLGLINGVAAVLMAMSGKLNWVIAFVLSALLLFLIGLGICGLMLQGLHGGH